MKKSIRGLTLSALLLSASTTVYGDQNEIYDGEGFVTPVAFVGDMPNHEEDAYFAEDADEADEAISQASHNAAMQHRAKVKPQAASTAKTQRPVAQQRSSTQPAQRSVPAVQQQAYTQSQQYAPIQSYQMHTPFQQVSWCDSPSCSTPGCAGGCDSAPPACGCDSIACDGGCDSMGGGSKGCSLGSSMGLCTKDGWFRHEALLWFVQDRDMIPLVTVSSPGTDPEIGLGDTQVAFGNQIEGDLSLGYRGDIGMYVSDNVGIGGRLWIMEDNGDSYFNSGDGSAMSIGRPFYDDIANVNNSLLIASTIPGQDFTGSISINSEVSLMAAEAYARLNFSCSKSCQLDFIGGYSYFQVDDMLSAVSSTQDATAINSFNDLFETENRFNGGQIGFEAIVKRGRWFARSLTKVHLGNMDQTVRISGGSSQDFGPNVVTADNGFLSTVDTQGTYENEEFTFIPEMNFKLGYRFRDHIEMSAGYTFIYFDNTALVGDVIDDTLNPAGFFQSTAASRPGFEFSDSSLWVQGLDLGIAISF